MMQRMKMWILAVCGVWLVGCTQMVRIEVIPSVGERFVVDTGKTSPDGKPALDRRYDAGGQKIIFNTGTPVPIDKFHPPTVRVVNKAGGTVWAEEMKPFPMAWYESLLIPLFGLGYAIYEPYAYPYRVGEGGGDLLLKTAQDMAAQILEKLPPSAKVVGVAYIESEDVEKGDKRPYVSEGNRKLSEYLCNSIRETRLGALTLREYKYGASYYLKHSGSALGASTEARRELLANFAREERLDVLVYGKNYAEFQPIAADKRGDGTGYERGIQNCRLEFDILDGKNGATIGRVSQMMQLGVENWKISQLFRPALRDGPDFSPPSLEVVLERAAQHLSRDILEKLTAGNVLATYPKPVTTFVSDFGYVVATPDNRRETKANKYGAYMSEKVSLRLQEASAGQFLFVERKELAQEKKTVVGERSAWISEDDAPQLGRRLGAKVIFFGRMEKIGADLKITLSLRDTEAGVVMARAEHTLLLTPLLDTQLEYGNEPK